MWYIQDKTWKMIQNQTIANSILYYIFWNMCQLHTVNKSRPKAFFFKKNPLKFCFSSWIFFMNFIIKLILNSSKNHFRINVDFLFNQQQTCSNFMLIANYLCFFFRKLYFCTTKLISEILLFCL